MWHKSCEELPEYGQEVIVMYDNGRISYNHRVKSNRDGWPLTDEMGWCRYSTTRTEVIVLWTEVPMYN